MNILGLRVFYTFNFTMSGSCPPPGTYKPVASVITALKNILQVEKVNKNDHLFTIPQAFFSPLIVSL